MFVKNIRACAIPVGATMSKTRTEWIAQRLKSILEKTGNTPADIERKTLSLFGPPVSAVTVRRILNATARTEPERVTLERIADAVGMPYAVAFPEWDPDVRVRMERTIAALKEILDEEDRDMARREPPGRTNILATEKLLRRMRQHIANMEEDLKMMPTEQRKKKTPRKKD